MVGRGGTGPAADHCLEALTEESDHVRTWPMAAHRTVCSHRCLQTWTFGARRSGKFAVFGDEVVGLVIDGIRQPIDVNLSGVSICGKYRPCDISLACTGLLDISEETAKRRDILRILLDGTPGRLVEADRLDDLPVPDGDPVVSKAAPLSGLGEKPERIPIRFGPSGCLCLGTVPGGGRCGPCVAADRGEGKRSGCGEQICAGFRHGQAFQQLNCPFDGVAIDSVPAQACAELLSSSRSTT
ncbi:hypothetical protein OG520_40720 (plasmid) [Streptomyces sp. NBC_00984]|nr:hypothetical protein OG520_40720 [Streptomyces sp. NBC_00984]